MGFKRKLDMSDMLDNCILNTIAHLESNNNAYLQMMCELNDDSVDIIINGNFNNDSLILMIVELLKQNSDIFDLIQKSLEIYKDEMNM